MGNSSHAEASSSHRKSEGQISELVDDDAKLKAPRTPIFVRKGMASPSKRKRQNTAAADGPDGNEYKVRKENCQDDPTKRSRSEERYPVTRPWKRQKPVEGS